MRVSQFDIRGDAVLGDLAVEFPPTASDVSVHMLVGANGSGKTQLLELLFACMSGHFARGTPGATYEMQIDARDDSTIHLHMETRTKNSGKVRGEIRGGDNDGTFTDLSEAGLVVAFSTAETVFSARRIEHATGRTLTQEPQVVRADQLNQRIPQLLADLQIQDGTTGTHSIQLFRDAFAHIMQGQKRLDRVEPLNPGYEIVFVDPDGAECAVDELSTGEKQVVFRLGFLVEQIALAEDAVVLIDEPELSLHPAWQTRYVDALRLIFQGKRVHVIAATHSPYLIEGLSPHDACLLVDRSTEQATPLKLTVGGNDEPPSPYLVAHQAFGVWSDQLHSELFNRLFVSSGCSNISRFNDWLANTHGLSNQNRSVSRHPKFQDGRTAEEVGPVWIRNYAHHPDNVERLVPGPVDIAASVHELLRLLA